MPDARPPLSQALTAFGVTAIIQPTGGATVVAIVIDTARPAAPGVGVLGPGLSSVVDLRKVVAVPRSVPSLPVGSTIFVDLDGTGAREWRVDRVEALMPDEYRVVVS